MADTRKLTLDTALDPTALRPDALPVATDLYALQGETEERIGDSPFAEQLDWRRAVARREYRDEVRRLRAGVRVGLVIWPAFVIVDLLVMLWIEASSPAWFVVSRIIGMLVLGALALVLRGDPPPSMRVVRPLEVGGVAILAALVTVMSLPAQNYGGSYVAGIILLILTRAVLIPAPWRRGVIPALLIGMTYPVGQLIGALVIPDFAERLMDARSAAMVAVNVGYLTGAGALAVLLSNVVWRTRRASFAIQDLGRYRLVRRIGSGGMGEVWQAYHRGIKLDVALKVLKPERGDSAEAVKRFEREVLATTRLSHPNTIRIIDHGITAEGLWYYAMELLQGEDLAQLIGRGERLTPERTVHLIRQACASLAEAHGKGFVHRDIKPENLYVTEQGGIPDFVKVLDFGIAKVSQDLEDEQLTREGVVSGTPLYMSPEAIAAEGVDARSDVYALGCVMYTALCGRAPFDAPSAMALLVAHLNHPPEPFSTHTEVEVPAELEGIVMRCLAKDPADRYEDAQALGQALGDWAGGSAVSPPPPLR